MKRLFISLALVVVVSVGLALPLTQSASATVKSEICGGIGEVQGSEKCGTAGAGTGAINSLVQTIIKWFSIIVGIIAVIMLVLSGLKFITSGGDSQKVASAKSGVLYGIIGLVLVGAAQIIVHFVLSKTQ